MTSQFSYFSFALIKLIQNHTRSVWNSWWLSDAFDTSVILERLVFKLMTDSNSFNDFRNLRAVEINQILSSAGDEEKHKKLMSCKANEEVGLEAKRNFLISWQEIHTLCSCISSGGLSVFHLNQWSASLSFSSIIIMTCSICYSASYWFHPLLLYPLFCLMSYISINFFISIIIKFLEDQTN